MIMQQGKMLEPMSSIDSFWLSMDEPTNLMVITGLMEFDELLDYDAVCALLKVRLLCYNRFRQKVVWPTWNRISLSCVKGNPWKQEKQGVSEKRGRLHQSPDHWAFSCGRPGPRGWSMMKS